MEQNLIAIATCCRNDGRYLIEWACYYCLLGVDALLIYNNESDDETSSVLAQLERLLPIEVMVKNWPTVPDVSPQLSAFEDAVREARGRFRFLGFFDTDEFLVPQSGQGLSGFLSALPATASAVAVNQRVFGSSGRKEAGEGLVVSRFKKANKSEAEENEYFKTIARTDRIAGITDPHFVNLTEGEYVDTRGERLARPYPHPGRSGVVCEDGFRLHHYMLKSWAEFNHKRQRGGGASSDAAVRMARFNDDYFYGRDALSNACAVELPAGMEDMLRDFIRSLGLQPGT